MVEQGEFRRGVRIGVDVGSVRVGIAKTDRDGVLATPVATITGERPDSLEELAAIVDTENAMEVIVGLPRSLSGAEGRAAHVARAYAGSLANVVDVPVRVVDERLTTVSAHSAMHASGRKGRKHRQVVDQVAAVVILQHALDVERNTHMPAGELIPPGRTKEES